MLSRRPSPERDDWYALYLALDDDIVGEAILPNAEDVLVAARPAILDEKREHGVRPATRVDA
jgi:hypothetical protein